MHCCRTNELYPSTSCSNRVWHSSLVLASFIRREGDEALIVARSRRQPRLLACVGYVDLRSQVPLIEYRVSRVGLFMLCMPLGPLALLLITIPFLWWLLKADFTQEQATLREFLRDCRVANETGTPLVRTMLTIGYDAKRGFYWDHD